MKININLQRDGCPELKKRIPTFIIFGGIFVAVLFFRLWYLQIAMGDRFRDLSENNRIRLVKIPAPRGKIFDRTGRVLVDNRPAFSLSIVPEDISDWEGLKNRLHDLLNMEPSALEEKIQGSKGHPPFNPVNIKKDMIWEEVSLIEVNRMDLPGTIIDIKPRRHYLHSDLACHLLGYLGEITGKQLEDSRYSGYHQGDLVGKYGVEETLESYLRGEDGGCQVEVDCLGRQLDVLREIEPTPGKNIFLSIDLDLQRLAEEIFKVDAGALIAINPQNGFILAMVNRPSFDPNLFVNRMSREQWNIMTHNPFRPLENKAIQGQYPPGSVFKIITAAAGLEEKIIDPGSKYFCLGTYSLGTYTYRDWKKEGHGLTDIHKALVVSCDVFFYDLGKKIGIDEISRYARGFGLGEVTGLGLKGELSGLVPTSNWKLREKKESWHTGETLSVAIGQGFLLTTPIQILNMISAIANGGKIFRPQVIKRIETADGTILKKFYPVIKKKVPASESTIQLIKDALGDAVNRPHGTGWRAKIKGVEVAGKTGTAQVVKLKSDNDPDSDEGEIPYQQRDHAWFVAFAPKERAGIAVIVLVEHGGHGGRVAAPIARKLINGYLATTQRRNPSGPKKSYK